MLKFHCWAYGVRKSALNDVVAAGRTNWYAFFCSAVVGGMNGYGLLPRNGSVERNVEDRGVQDVGLNEREAVQADGGEIVVEDAVSATQRRLAVTEDVVGEADARREVMPIGVDHVGG